MTSFDTKKASAATEPRPQPEKADLGATEPPPDHTSHYEKAARSVMHPDYHDPDWRYYHGAMGG